MPSNNGKKTKVCLLAGALIFFCIVRAAELPLASGGAGLSSPKQNGYYDYKGVIHWHTAYSKDCTGSYEEAARVSNRQHINFMISTEHNNLQAVRDKKEGWYAGTLILAGAEITRSDEGGHNAYLLGLNLNDDENMREDSTDKLLADIDRQGGLALIAHPKNPRWYWTGGIDRRILGQEILDLTDEWYTSSAGAIMTASLYYPFNTTAAYMQFFHRPAETLKAWDEITKNRNFVGIYAPDFHQAVQLPGNNKLRFPPVEEILPLAHDHILSAVPFSGQFLRDKDILYDALRRGHLYIAMDILDDATGFSFSAKQGSQSAWMGDQLAAGRAASFSVRLPEHSSLKNTTIHVYRNGSEIAESDQPAYSFQAQLPGAYRVEVEADIPTFWGFGKKIVWIYSNPIYLR